MRRALTLIDADFGRGRPDGDPLTDLSRGVGHRAHDGRVVQRLGEAADRCPGHNRDHEGFRSYRRTNLRQHFGQRLRLDREDHNIRSLGRSTIVIGGSDVPPVFELVAPLLTRGRGDDLTGGQQVAAQQARDHSIGHLSGTDECYCLIFQHSSSSSPTRRRTEKDPAHAGSSINAPLVVSGGKSLPP